LRAFLCYNVIVDYGPNPLLSASTSNPKAAKGDVRSFSSWSTLVERLLEHPAFKWNHLKADKML